MLTNNAAIGAESGIYALPSRRDVRSENRNIEIESTNSRRSSAGRKLVGRDKRPAERGKVDEQIHTEYKKNEQS